jgi:proteic killer suppression protein
LRITLAVVIRSFRHAGLEDFFRSGSKAGIRPEHAKKLRLILGHLNEAEHPLDMNVPGWNLHELKGELVQHWSVKVNGNWRVIFKFEGDDAVLVNYDDYH